MMENITGKVDVYTLICGIIIGIFLKYLFDHRSLENEEEQVEYDEPNREVRTSLTKCINCKFDQILFYPVSDDQICDNIRYSLECSRRSGTCRYLHDGPLAQLFRTLNTATSHLDICVYLINYVPLYNCLLRLREGRPGLKIRIITNLSDKGQDEGHINLRQELIGKKFDVKTNGSQALMHHKFAIIDRELVIHGSANWTHSAFRYNYEALHVTKQPKIVKPFRAQFNKLWKEFD